MQEIISNLLEKSDDRISFCKEFINFFNYHSVAEIGVFKGDYAQHILKNCPSVKTYVMVDPWRNLSDWNKPANKNDDTFNQYFKESMAKTDFAKSKRKILRGKTTEVVDQIQDNSLDFIYIDGDHTLKGITIDLVNLWPKLKANGVIIGDDFHPSIWQHQYKFEPTLVFPFAVYFAEAVNAKIYALPYGQFAIKKDESKFEFIDLTKGKYSNLELRNQLLKESVIKKIVKKYIPFATTLYKLFSK